MSNNNSGGGLFDLGPLLDVLRQYEQTRTQLNRQAAEISANVQSIRTAAQASIPAESLAQIQDAIESVREVAEYFAEVRDTVETTIDVGEPWDYDPSESEIDSLARDVALRWTFEFMDELDSVEDEYFDPINDRLKVGLEAYIGGPIDNVRELDEPEPRPHEAVFIFISAQDALMHWLCEQDPNRQPRIDTDNETVYTSGQKRDVLEEKYTALFNIADSGDQFRNNLDAFYKHRNFIMHGNPQAHFDLNIATVALLFYSLTLHTVIEEAS